MKAEKPSSRPASPRADWEHAPLEWPRASGQVEQLLSALAVRERRQRLRRAGAALGAMVLTGLAFFFVFTGSDPGRGGRAGDASSGTAAIALPEKQMLPDGSAVELRTGAKVDVRYSAAMREVELREGEALFQVVKDRDRPFVVRAGNVQFRAVGTAFSVGLGRDSVEMLVTEGRVVVERLARAEADFQGRSEQETVAAGGAQAEPPHAVATVDAGQRVVLPFTDVAQPAVVLPASAAETTERLAWRVPRLEFNETPLVEVVALLNQHSGLSLHVTGDTLGRVQISGALRADNVEPLLETLAANYGIEVVRESGRPIELRPAR